MFSHILLEMLWQTLENLPSEKISLQYILLGQVNVRSSQSFTQPVMFDLEIEAAVGGGGRERWIVFTTPPHSSPYFWPLFTPLAQISIFS